MPPFLESVLDPWSEKAGRDESRILAEIAHDKRRSETLSDVEGERKFVTKRDEEQAKRVEQGLKNANRLRLRAAVQELGGDTSDDDSEAKLIKQMTALRSDRAELSLAPYKSGIKDLNQRFSDSISKFVTLSAGGQKAGAAKAALQTALLQLPDIDKKIRAELENTIKRTKDDEDATVIAEAVNAAASKIRGTFLWPGNKPAKQLQDSFISELPVIAEGEKKAALIGLQAELGEVARQIDKTTDDFRTAWAKHGADPHPEKATDYLRSFDPVATQKTSLPSRAVDAAVKLGAGQPTATATSPASLTPSPVSEAIDKEGLVGAFKGLSNADRLQLITAPSGFALRKMLPDSVNKSVLNIGEGISAIPDLAKRLAVGPSGTSSPPISPAQMLPAMRDAQAKLKALPDQVKRDIFKMAVTLHPEEQERISTNSKLIESGDPSDPATQSAISGALKILRIYRQGSPAESPVESVPGFYRQPME